MKTHEFFANVEEERRCYEHLRYGQAVFFTASKLLLTEDEKNGVWDSPYDCFYDDSKVGAFIEYLKKRGYLT